MTDTEQLLAALHSLRSFVAVMVGRGPDAIIPDTITSPIGVPIKIGEIMRDADAAIAAWNRRTPASGAGVVKPAVYIGAKDAAAYVTDDMQEVVLAAFAALPTPPFGEKVLPLYLSSPPPDRDAALEVQRILDMSDEQVLAEVVARGEDPEAIADEMRARFFRILSALKTKDQP